MIHVTATIHDEEPRVLLRAVDGYIIVETTVGGVWHELFRARGSLRDDVICGAAESALKLTDEQWYQHHDARNLYHAAEVERLKHVCESTETAGKRVTRETTEQELRRENEKMRPVVEAAIAHRIAKMQRADRAGWSGDDDELDVAVDAYRTGKPTTQPAAVELSNEFAVNVLAQMMMSEWHRVEGEPVNVSRIATFVDMARRILRDYRAPQPHANRNALDETDLRRLREATVAAESLDGPPRRVELVALLRSLLDSGKLGGGQ